MKPITSTITLYNHESSKEIKRPWRKRLNRCTRHNKNHKYIHTYICDAERVLRESVLWTRQNLLWVYQFFHNHSQSEGVTWCSSEDRPAPREASELCPPHVELSQFSLNTSLFAALPSVRRRNQDLQSCSQLGTEVRHEACTVRHEACRGMTISVALACI